MELIFRNIELENLHVRSEQDYWAVGGRAINWDTPTQVTDFNLQTGEPIASYVEEFAPDSIMIPASGAVLRDDHGEDVGLLTRSEMNDKGWDVELSINKTEAGRRVREEIQQGKKHSFSIGMAEKPLESTFDAMRNVHRRLKALVKEISVTAAPQHLNTGVAYVRSNPQEEKKMPDENENQNGEGAPATPPAQPVTPAPSTENLFQLS